MRLKPRPKARTAAGAGLKPQPRPARGPRRPARPRARPKVGGRGARRPGTPLHRRLARRLPSLRRLASAFGAALAIAGLVALLAGPWLRVTDVSWAGGDYTSDRELERIVGRQRGTNVLTLDTSAVRARLAALPAVADASVTTSLPGRLEVTITEKAPAIVWQTPSTNLLAAADGTIFAALPRDAGLDGHLAELPRVDDGRSMARLMTTGDRIDDALLTTAMSLADLDPAALGSRAATLGVRIDDEYGFGLKTSDPGWELALGVYGTDPHESAEGAAARLERQITAVRTLFASRPETEIGWVDARNPGKVYFRAKG
jgi:cell division septal protein FtsQ